MINIDELKAEKCRRNFYYFIQEFWSVIIAEEPVWNWHIEYLANELQEVGYRIAQRLPKEKDIIINIPPSTSKSTICSIMFPVWLWAIDPSIKIITASYSSSLSLEQSVKSRTILKSELFKRYFPYVEIKEDQDTKGNYQTTQGGARYSTSTGATVTGLHGHIIIVDDPQSPELANSETERKTTNEWVSSTLSTRKVDKLVAVMAMIQQRLHPNDVTGYLLGKNKQYKHICLPAEISNLLKPKELSVNYKMGLLDINRLSPEILREMKVDLGTSGYNTQIGQAPENSGDSIIKKEWIKKISQEEFLKIKGNSVINFYVDSAYTDNKSNDPSAILAATKIGELLYVTAISQVWMEFPDFVKHLHEFVSLNGYTSQSRIKVEGKASGKSIVQYLRTQSSLNISEGKSPSTSKLERLHAISPKVEAGRTVLIEDSWNDTLVDEVSSNSPKNDDLRDVYIMAVDDLLITNGNRGKYSLV